MKLSIFLVLLASFVLPGLAATAHDYHASITDVMYNSRTQSLEVAVRVFTDDLENALSRRSQGKVTYSSTSEEVRRRLTDYLQASLSFELMKGKPLKYNFIGSEEEADVVWLYVEVPVHSAALPQVYVKNAILTEVFSDQMNIVNISYKGKTESVLLQRGEEMKKVEF